jgi:hypothetical protein
MAKEVVIDINVKTAKADKNVQNLNKDLQQTKTDISGIEDAADKATGGMVSGFRGALKGVKGMITGLKTMRGAIIATGIGALVLLVTSLTAAFTSSEEGQNQLAKGMAVLGAAVDVFTDRLAAFGRTIISMFTDTEETFKGFGKSIKEFVMDKVDKVVEGLGFMGTAISKLFKGDFSGALEDAGKGIVKLNQGLNPAVILTESLVKSTKDLITELKEEGKIAAQIADQRAKADKVDRQIIVDRAKANRDRAELLEKAVNKEKYNVQERIGFLEEAARLEEEITNKEIAAAKLRLDAQIAENALGDSNKEALEKEAQLKANLINLETAKLTKAKEVTSQTIALKAEETAALKAIEDERIAAEVEAKKIADEQIAEGIVKQEEADKIELERKQRILDEDKAIEEQRIAQREATFQNAVTLVGAETKLGKALLLAKQLILAREFIMDAKATILKAKSAVINSEIKGTEAVGEVAGSVAKAANTAPPPFNIPFILTALLTGASIISAVKGAIGATKAAAAAAGGGGGGGASVSTPQISPSSPPAFNVVGASETNQLAGAIGSQTQQPVQAFVVANAVTTAQSLERNIIEGASIG